MSSPSTEGITASTSSAQGMMGATSSLKRKRPGNAEAGRRTLVLEGAGAKCCKAIAHVSLEAHAQEDTKEFVIGRLPTAAVIIEDVNVSRRHAVVTASKEHWTITDQKDYVWRVSDIGSTAVSDSSSSLTDQAKLNVGEISKSVEEKEESRGEEGKPSEPTTMAVDKSHSEDEVPPIKRARSSLAAEVKEEFCCSICCDIFIEPRSLPCGHVFCQYCLLQWKAKTVSKQVCPFCRERFRGDGLRNFVLENLIKSWEQKLSPEDAEQRQKALQERREDFETFQKHKNKKEKGKEERVLIPAPAGSGATYSITSFFNREGAASADHRAGVTTRRGRRMANRGSGAPRNRRVVITLSTDESPNEEETVHDSSHTNATDLGSDSASDSEQESSQELTASNSSSESSVEGLPGSYYGGYGNCFNCGRSGHWAPGCPFQ